MNLIKRLSLIILLTWGIVFPSLATGLDATKVRVRLSKIEKDLPLPYNDALLSDIKTYMSKQLPTEFSTYSSMIEEAIGELGLPPEFLYFPMALTEMNSNHLQDGRAGLWDLPTLVALRYGLTVDENHDERFSVEASTQAALLYLKDLHTTFGDWWSCILAYANSPATLNNARARHAELGNDPWAYYELGCLPNINIIGNLIACYFVYSDDVKTVARPTEAYVECSFSQPISVAAISAKTGVSKQTILNLNPIFRSDPFTPFESYRIRLPQSAGQAFEQNKTAIYNETAQAKAKKEEEQQQVAQAEKQKAKAKAAEYITYTVKSGDYLGKIAKKHNVTVKDLKKWNKLKNDFIREGQKLKIYK